MALFVRHLFRWFLIRLASNDSLDGSCLNMRAVANATAKTPQSKSLFCFWHGITSMCNSLLVVFTRLAQLPKTKSFSPLKCLLSKMATRVLSSQWNPHAKRTNSGVNFSKQWHHPIQNCSGKPIRALDKRNVINGQDSILPWIKQRSCILKGYNLRQITIR